MSRHLNFFFPFASAPAWHENQITRGLLVVLRFSALAHQGWLDLVAPRRALHALPPAVYATQRQRILTSGEAVAEGEEIPGISVWLAPDADHVAAVMESSDRQQVLDAVINYGTDLVIVVENKVNWGAPTEQPSRINLHGAPVRFEGPPRSVRWQDVLAMLSNLLERGLVHGAERFVIEDFLELVEEHFPHLGPYATLSQCGSNGFRLSRRLDAIQGLAVGSTEAKDEGWRDLEGTPKIFMAGLLYLAESSAVSLQMFPADTLGQARPFYADPASVRDVLALRSDGWRIRPNFHWGFTQTGYAWASSPVGVEDYCAYWLARIEVTREVARHEWPAYLSTLVADRIIDESGRATFEQEFGSSRRQKASPRPGLFCEYIWPLAEAADLDARGRFVGAVRERMNQMLAALRAPLLSTG